MVVVVISIVVAIFAVKFKEEEEEISETVGICDSVKLLGGSLKEKNLRNLMILIVLRPLLVPSFSMFKYYFVTETLGISQYVISMLTIIGFLCIFFGTQLFSLYTSSYELRTNMIIAVILTVVTMPLPYILFFRVAATWVELPLIIFIDIASDVKNQAFILLPLLVIFAKVIPKDIEASCFAMFSGASNLSIFLSSIIGTQIN